MERNGFRSPSVNKTVNLSVMLLELYIGLENMIQFRKKCIDILTGHAFRVWIKQNVCYFLTTLKHFFYFYIYQNA